MKQTVRLLLLLMLTLGLVSLVAAQDSIGVGDTVEGEADGDQVEYEIELEAGQEVVITLESDDFDTIVRVEFDGDEVDSNDDGDGMGLNSLLEFEADEAGTYTIVVDAFGGDPEGTFELSVEGMAMDEETEDEDDGDSAPSGDADLVYDDAVDFDADGEDELAVTFNGEGGDVITILASSDADQTFDIFLLDPDGDVYVEDTFNYDTASLVRIELADDGLYTVRLVESDDEELEDDYEIEVLLEEALDLSEGPQTSAELNRSREQDYMFFEAEDNVTYVVFVEIDGDIDSSVNIELCEGDREDCFFGDVRVSLAGVEQAAFSFEASDDGIVGITLDYFAFDGDVEVTISVEEE